jgi:hypothetical protein
VVDIISDFSMEGKLSEFSGMYIQQGIFFLGRG